ncbi:MAG: hypothetical protein HC825_03605 [Oscillatoriales cyanobacterium RM1_1_9]|nr:hypothetical protein [Oscillatoriales cyanobacterium RM1_1_9]
MSLLNNSKYSYDIQPSQIRLTLLRGSVWPDPEADGGIHQFTYAIYPHIGSWQGANVVHRGYELNQPLRVNCFYPEEPESSSSSSSDRQSFLDLNAKNLILMAFKQSEFNPQEWILRCYESAGESANLVLTGHLEKQIIAQVNLLEEVIDSDSNDSSTGDQTLSVSPWKIVSFKLD